MISLDVCIVVFVVIQAVYSCGPVALERQASDELVSEVLCFTFNVAVCDTAVAFFSKTIPLFLLIFKAVFVQQGCRIRAVLSAILTIYPRLNKRSLRGRHFCTKEFREVCLATNQIKLTDFFL